jgi:2,4-dienoyl-CoA reductase-like NADH-dependent reductase (Old Yellow Enzyme family)
MKVSRHDRRSRCTVSRRQKREAYFLPFAAKIRLAVKTPIMLTGGFRSAAAMNAAVDSGADRRGRSCAPTRDGAASWQSGLLSDPQCEE